MLASVIVPVFNRKELIGNCLQSLLQQTIDDYEIIVVDDGSTDGTGEVIARINHPKIIALYNEINKGLGYSRNRGIAESRGSFIAFTDSDCIVDKTWLELLIKPFALDASIMIVGGKILDPKPDNYWGLVNKGKDFIASQAGYVTKVIGCNMAFCKKFILENKFDEAMTRAADDFDIAIRCLRKGYKIYFTAAALITHYQRSTFYATVRQQFFYGQQNARAYFKNHIFPYMSYGSWLILGIIFSFINSHPIMQFSLMLLYMFIVILQGREVVFWKKLLVFPGRLIGSLANSLGNISYLLSFLSHPLLQLIGKKGIFSKPRLAPKINE